eukprot:scaffold100396_cov33-Tisochrysis_lutea.AAC.4
MYAESPVDARLARQARRWQCGQGGEAVAKGLCTCAIAAFMRSPSRKPRKKYWPSAIDWTSAATNMAAAHKRAIDVSDDDIDQDGVDKDEKIIDDLRAEV